jgi:hypothetical protein
MPITRPKLVLISDQIPRLSQLPYSHDEHYKMFVQFSSQQLNLATKAVLGLL